VNDEVVVHFHSSEVAAHVASQAKALGQDDADRQTDRQTDG